MSEAQQCRRFVSWWDGEYEGNCERPEGHDGDHFDGMSWFDDDGEARQQDGAPADWIRS